MLSAFRSCKEGLISDQLFEHPIPETETQDEKLIQTFAGAVKESGLSTREWVVVLPAHFFTLDIVTLPAVKRKDLEALIRRRLSRSSAAKGTKKAWSYEILQENTAGDEHTLKVLIARINQDRLMRIHAALRATGLKIKFLTLPLAAVIQLMRHRGKAENQGASLAVELSSGHATLSVFLGDILQQVRFLKEKEGFNFNQFLCAEIKRTLAYYKERSKGGEIDEILILGSQAERMDRVNHSIPVSVDLPAIDLANDVADRGLLSLIAGADLSAEGKKTEARINFTPARKNAFCGALLLVLILACAMAGVLEWSTHIEEENRTRAAQLTDLQQATWPFARFREERDRLINEVEYHGKVRAFLDELASSRPCIGEPLLALHEHLPSEAKVRSAVFSHSVESAGEENRLQIRISGDFTGKNTSKLLHLVQGLQATGLFHDVFFTSRGVTRSTNGKERLQENVDLELLLP